MLILGSSCYCWFAYVCMIWWQRTFLQKLASGHNDFSNLRHFFSTHKRTGLAQAQPPSTHWPRSTGCRRQSGASRPLSFGYLAIWVAPCWNDQQICFKNKPGNDQLPTKSNCCVLVGSFLLFVFACFNALSALPLTANQWCLFSRSSLGREDHSIPVKPLDRASGQTTRCPLNPFQELLAHQAHYSLIILIISKIINTH